MHMEVQPLIGPSFNSNAAKSRPKYSSYSIVASQHSAARAKQRGTIPSIVELVAACAMSVKTKLPGPNSFTSHLIRQLKIGLDTSGQAKISDIVNALADRNSGYRQTPVHFTGLRSVKASICLEPFNRDFDNVDYAKGETAWLTLRISLRDVVLESLMCELID